jgi:hypothetical protein
LGGDEHFRRESQVNLILGKGEQRLH